MPFPAGAPHRGGNAWQCERCGAERVDRQLGLEPTVQDYVAALVDVFGEVRRVLADHGTVWLNLGDLYASAPAGNTGTPEEKFAKSGLAGARAGSRYLDTLESSVQQKRNTVVGGLRPKNLVGMAWRVAFGLQDDGWTLRAGCVWDKANAMPESVRDRPTMSHEFVFMLTKRPKGYWYDRVAVLEPFEMKPQRRLTPREENPEAKVHGQPLHRRPEGGTGGWEPPQPDTLPGLPPPGPRGADGRMQTTLAPVRDRAAHENYANREGGERWPDEGRNMRSVWRLPTQPLHDAHFAVFPEALVERCLNASCPPEVCSSCGKPRVRIVAREGGPQGDHVAAASRSGELDSDSVVRDTGRSSRAAGSALSDRYREHGYATFDTAGWTDCGCGEPFVPGTVLDPFLGSGTTALVARRLGRRAVGIELNSDYAAIALERTQQLSLLAS